MTEQTLHISGMSCAACQYHVEKALRSVPGVDSAHVNLMAHTGTVLSESSLPAELLINAVRSAGYTASLPADAVSSAQPYLHETNTRTMLGLRAVVALAAGLVAMILSMPLMLQRQSGNDPLLSTLARSMTPWMPDAWMSLSAQPVRWVLCVLTVVVMAFAAPEVYKGAWTAARHRTTNMNTLVAIGTLAAFASSSGATIRAAVSTHISAVPDVYFEAVILILAFLLLGRWLEERARQQATDALRRFAKLEPKDARLLTLSATDKDYSNASETLLPIDALEAGDIVRVLAGERIPLDGVVIDGRSSVDESMISGEPLPVTRSVGEHVTGGTLNLDGVLVVRATAVGAESTLAQMQRLLAQAQSSRAPMQRLADRVSAIFVPTILVLAVTTFAVWAIVLNADGLHEGFGRPFSFALSVLIIACPCAMGLAVPAAITVAVGSAAREGLLIKGGDVLERLAQVNTIALDKTGTLTEGQPEIVSFQLATSATTSRNTLLTYAAAIERLSNHPVAKAVVSFCGHQTDLAALPPVHDFTVLPGTGLRATIGQHEITLGNQSMLPGAALIAALEPPSNLKYATPLYVLVDGIPQAAFFATDKLRPSASAALKQLRFLGLEPVLLTGDTAASAAPIAASALINDVRSSLLPSAKVTAIRELQLQGKRVAMVGDGINDAAALAQADSGLAMASGTDLTRDAGDVLLLHHDLLLLPVVVRLARRTVGVMRQNLGWALIYNVLGIPIAAGLLYPHFHIMLSPVVASAAMALSSVSVLTNSLRLRHVPKIGSHIVEAAHDTLRPAVLDAA